MIDFFYLDLTNMNELSFNNIYIFAQDEMLSNAFSK